jgi:hypothetical protein
VADAVAAAAITRLELLSRWHSSSSPPRAAAPARTADAAAAAAQAKFFGHTCKAVLKNANVMLCVRFRGLNGGFFFLFSGGASVMLCVRFRGLNGGFFFLFSGGASVVLCVRF